MAKCLIHSSPVSNYGESVNIESGDTLRKVLVRHGHGLDSSPLAVSVNGHFPEDLSLDYLIKEKDFIHVYRADVQGAQGDSTNKILGTLALIAAITLTVLTAGAASPLIAVAGAIGAAGLSALGSYLIARSREIPGQQTRAEVDSAANIFNISAATNQNRQMQPMRVPMGSHRYAPDYATMPYAFFSPKGVTENTDAGADFGIIASRNYAGTMPSLLTTTNATATVPNNGTTGVYQQNFGVPGTTRFIRVQLNTGVYNTNVQFGTGGGGTNDRHIIPYYSNNITNVNETTLDATGQDWEIISNQLLSGTGTTGGLGGGANWGFFGTVTGPASFGGVGYPTGTSYFPDIKIRRRVYIPRFFYDEIVFGASIPASLVITSKFFDTSSFNSGNPSTWPFVLVNAGGFTAYETIPTIVVNEIIINGNFGQPDLQTNLGWIDVIDNIIFGNLAEEFGINGANAHSKADWIQHTAELGNGDVVSDLEQVTTLSTVNPGFDNDGDEINAASRFKQLGQFGGFSITNAQYNQNDLSLDGNLASDQYISHIFHYGIGDIFAFDDRIKDTPIIDYGATANFINQEAYTNSGNNYTIDIRPDGSLVSIPGGPFGNCMYPLSSNVKLDKGVKLFNNDDIQNIVERTAPDGTIRCEISLQVHGIRQDPTDGELLPNPVQFRIECLTQAIFAELLYIDNTLSGAGGPIKNVNTDQPTPVQLTYCFEGLNPGIQHRFRLQKLSPDSEKAGEANNIEILHFSFFVEDNTDYTAENRYAILLSGADAINGQIEQFNSMVEAKCWKYNNGSYTWDFSRNPADWFLFTLLGIFKNDTAQFGTEVFPNLSPTDGWTTGIHPDNTEKLFGAGLPIDKIDIDNIMEWAQWCIDNNLNYDNVLMDTLNIAEALEIIANGGRATVSYQSGKIGVVYESPDDVPTAMFGMGNIIKDSFNITYETYDIPTEIVGVFSDRNDFWKSKKVKARVPYSPNDSLNSVEVVLTGITEESRAQREVNLASYRKYFQRSSYSWKTSIEGLVVKRADLVYLSHDLTCFSHSTRVFEFELDGTNVKRLNLGDCVLESGSNMLLLRTVDGIINNYQVQLDSDGWVSLVDNLPASDVSHFIDDKGSINPYAAYNDTYPSDILVFVGIGGDIGKILRVISVEPGDNNTEVLISAVPEDPIIWTAEFNHIDNPAELNPDILRIESKVKNATYHQEGNKIFLQVELEGSTGFSVVDNSTGNPILNNDVSYSFSGNNNCITLVPGNHSLTINPFNQYSPYNAEPYTLNVVVE